MKLRYTLAVAALLGGGCGGDAEEAPCPVVGTYTMEFSSTGGDCPSDLRQSVTSTRLDVEVTEEDECGAFSGVYSESDESCTYEWTLNTRMTTAGFEQGTSVWSISCNNGAMCEERFNVYFERR